MQYNELSVVWVSESLGTIGGSEYCTIAMTRLLAEAGVKVAIATPPGVLSSWRHLAGEAGIIIYEAMDDSEAALLRVAAELCRSQRAKVVHFVPWSKILGHWSRICPQGTATVALEPTSGDCSCWWLPEASEAPVIALAVLTPAAQVAMRQRLGTTKPVHLVPNTLLPLLPLEQRPQASRVGAVARFSEEKGLGFLIAAFALLPKELDHVTLHLFGSGPEQGAMERLAVMLGIAHRVFFEGEFEPVFGLQQALAEIDVGVLPSLFEGQSIALMEWMALGIPVVATQTAGTVSVLGADYMHLTQIADTRHLSIVLSRLLRSQPLRAEARRHGLERLSQLNQPQKSLQSLLELYSIAMEAVSRA